MDIPTVKIGVNVFVFRDDKLLMGKRIVEVGTGTWCLPGGHLEFGESLTEAAIRELKEETSIEANNLKFIQLINQPKNGKHYVHINFLAKDWKWEPKVMEPNKFTEWRWFGMEELPEKIFEGHQQFIPAFLKKVNFVA